MARFNLEKPDAVFIRVPQIEDICIEFGIDKSDAETITCMYELYTRITGNDKLNFDEEAYNEGYRNGYNDAIDEAESKVDAIAWEIGKLKKS